MNLRGLIALLAGIVFGNTVWFQGKAGWKPAIRTAGFQPAKNLKPN